MRSIFLRFAAFMVAVVVLIPAGANAATFDFDLTFDGTSISVDSGSVSPLGTTLVVGDSYTLDFQAANNDFWRVDSSYSDVFIPLSFGVLPGGNRVGSVTSTFTLDGVQTAQIVEPSVDQVSVHVGAQLWSLMTGLEFDKVSLVYTLLSETTTTTIQNINVEAEFGFAFNRFFRDDRISYNTGSVSTVPVPAALPLFGTGLAVMGFIGWRRKRKVTA